MDFDASAISLKRSKAKLTQAQQIGLKHFNDLSKRMCWTEADRIKDLVESVALEVQEGLLVEGCGSYRYKSFCPIFLLAVPSLCTSWIVLGDLQASGRPACR